MRSGEEAWVEVLGGGLGEEVCGRRSGEETWGGSLWPPRHWRFQLDPGNAAWVKFW